MIPIKREETDFTITAESARLYISQMLKELSTMAQSSGLKELASLLRATDAASQIDLNCETEF